MRSSVGRALGVKLGGAAVLELECGSWSPADRLADRGDTCGGVSDRRDVTDEAGYAFVLSKPPTDSVLDDIVPIDTTLSLLDASPPLAARCRLFFELLSSS